MENGAMKNKNLILPVLGLVVVVLIVKDLVFWNAEKSSQDRPRRWEYKIFSMPSIHADEDERQLNGLGNDGWEMVTTMGPNFLFKRAKL